MAKIRTGAVVGQISGSIGSQTYSHNRYGAYIRQRSVPVTSTTEYAQAAKGFLAAASSAWKSLTAAQRLAWGLWSQNNPVTDVLGDKRVLTGHAAYVKLGCRVLRVGETLDTDPPVDPAPEALSTVSVTAAVGTPPTVSVVFTPTPQGAGVRVWVYAAKVESAGIEFIQNRLRLVYEGSAAETSPIAIGTVCAARLGTFQAGETLHVQALAMDEDTGLISPPLRASAVIT